eukprot:COSAG06_NODE_228_length_19725_cov_8.167839_6_plen_58_part_00
MGTSSPLATRRCIMKGLMTSDDVNVNVVAVAHRVSSGEVKTTKAGGARSVRNTRCFI